ncbi:MAG: hypothetical protein HUU23_10130 [Caldilineales bacterium]|nr:hypothetical protein [Caldilineales bacterium]
MTAREYIAEVQAAIGQAVHVLLFDVRFDEIDVDECYIKGVLMLRGGYQLYIAEYVITGPKFERSKYRYHLQRVDGEFIVRWDNAPHHRHVSSFPHHRHEADGSLHVSEAMDVAMVLRAAVDYI